MYRIGIIDDVKNERDDIQVSILDNKNINEDVSFKEYELKYRSREALFREIREDVTNEKIHALIVDFKLDTSDDVIKGWEIIEFAHNEFPEFPVVIMTNAPDESKESDYTDADKVYAKKIFLNPELDETKELVRNIILNVERYVSIRRRLEAELTVELQKLENDRTDIQILGKIIKIENDLKKYKQIYQTTLDSELEMNDLKEVFELLDKYEKLLEK